MGRIIRLLIAAICVILAAAIVITAGLPQRSAASGLYLIGQTPIAPDVGAVAPPIETFDVQGNRFSLNKLRGTIVVVNFWATWCGPCVTEMPMLEAEYQRHRAEGLHIVGVDVGESPAEVLAWTHQFGLTYDFVVDGEGRLSYLYELRGLPATFFIGPEGLVRQTAAGALNADQFEAAWQASRATK